MSNSVHKKIGANLRALRLAANMTQDKLGKKIGVTFQQIQKYEIGANAINPDKMIRIAKALGCQIPDLYKGLINGDSQPFDWSTLISRSDLSIVHAYHAIKAPKQKAALLRLARTLSEGEAAE